MRKKATSELCRIDEEGFKKAAKLPVTVVIDNVRSALNIGSIFRTADAFPVERIIICGISQTPPSKEIHKTALGAEMSVEWSYANSAIEAVESLKAEGYVIVAIEQTTESTSLDSFIPSGDKHYALILGNEVEGVSDNIVAVSDLSLEIPQMGTKHSLNVSVAAGVVLWHFFKEMKELL